MANISDNRPSYIRDEKHIHLVKSAGKRQRLLSQIPRGKKSHMLLSFSSRHLSLLKSYCNISASAWLSKLLIQLCHLILRFIGHQLRQEQVSEICFLISGLSGCLFGVRFWLCAFLLSCDEFSYVLGLQCVC
jgi:hypothetical protein